MENQKELYRYEAASTSFGFIGLAFLNSLLKLYESFINNSGEALQIFHIFIFAVLTFLLIIAFIIRKRLRAQILQKMHVE